MRRSETKASPLTAGHVAIVTGASSGIGRATALALANRGLIVVLVARRREKLAELLEEIRPHSPQSCVMAGDVGDKAFVSALPGQVMERFGRIDILINNAGIPMHRLIYRITAEEAEAVMRVNFLSCLWACFAAIPLMLRQGGGTIVNVSSFGSIVPPTHESVYVASKSAMNGFTRGLWGDLAGSGIHAVLLHPGPIATEIWGHLDEPGAYQGKTWPAETVARDILWAIERRAFEVVSPRRNFTLGSARWMSFLFPSAVRKGVARMDPVRPAMVEEVRAALVDADK